MIRRILTRRDEPGVRLNVDLSPPKPRRFLTMAVDDDIFRLFDNNGAYGRSTRVHRVLRALVDAQRRRKEG